MVARLRFTAAASACAALPLSYAKSEAAGQLINLMPNSLHKPPSDPARGDPRGVTQWGAPLSLAALTGFGEDLNMVMVEVA